MAAHPAAVSRSLTTSPIINMTNRPLIFLLLLSGYLTTGKTFPANKAAI